MNTPDYLVLFGTLAAIVGYGVWKTRGQQNIKGYFLGNKSLKWGTVGLSVMATQASAITFISVPGQAYENGMGFVQNYFGLPIALIIISAVFVPIFYKLNVYTAYEFLESRFNLKTRLLGAFLFLIQRGLAAGITIYAPAIIVSGIVGWDLVHTILIIGALVIVYTVSGGAKAVSITQKQQMTVIMLGMFVAFLILIRYINQHISLGDALHLAGSLGKLDAVDFDLNFEKRYTVWSGLLGGLFLSLSYFGTDQSQVQRYIVAKNITEGRMGLMFNAVLKIPMQFFILFVGVTVYVFYIFNTPPIHFKDASVQQLLGSPYKEEYLKLEREYQALHGKRKKQAVLLSSNPDARQKNDFLETDQKIRRARSSVKELIAKTNPVLKTKDSDYIFLTFIMTYLPHGLIGLLLAVIFSAAMSSSSAELSALASTTSIDVYKRLFKAKGQKHVWVSKLLTFGWGILAVSFALLAGNSENLIEAVNIIGSIFYGTILGLFLVAFFMKWIKGNSVFPATVISQVVVIMFHFLVLHEVISLGYLWYNAIGLILVIVLSALFQVFERKR